ncbi:MAG: anthranilate synthase component I [Calothrix sp. CSU_2_0]|nr:anthranilate synthase component I [Calothrix sp. CSU_2_0]
MFLIQPWHWRSLPLNQRSGSDVFMRLFLTDEIATLLESPYPPSPDYPQLGRYSICAGSPRVVNGEVQLWTPPTGEILPFLQQLLDRPRPEAVPDSLPFTGGWLGWLGYDLAWEIERLPYLKSDGLPFPVAYWYEPDCFAVLDHQQQILWLAATEKDRLHQMNDRLTNHPKFAGSVPSEASSARFYLSESAYASAVLQAQKHIQAGDIFQANLSLRFEAKTTAESWSIYGALQQINPSPFASYWKTPWGDVISCSPERLVKLQDRYAETRPIAGTRPRGQTQEYDRQLAEELISNIKEQAEHIMLVDLERNDLGRVCEWGSVIVDELLAIERYSHVMHLVSNIIGTLKPEFNAVDLIRALFPGGTITGCPKVRCMEIIETLEPFRRSLFYGSCGYLDWRGNLDLNILIRTLLYVPEAKGAIVYGQVGAGIVADSDPTREWHESLHKAQAQLAALKLAQSWI